MTDSDARAIFDKLDGITKQQADMNADLRVLLIRLDMHLSDNGIHGRPPCEFFKKHIQEAEDEKKEGAKLSAGARVAIFLSLVGSVGAFVFQAVLAYIKGGLK